MCHPDESDNLRIEIDTKLSEVSPEEAERLQSTLYPQPEGKK